MKWKQARCESGGCVAVAAVGDQIALRSTERPGVVLLDRQEWDAFVAGVRAGDFDELPAGGDVAVGDLRGDGHEVCRAELAELAQLCRAEASLHRAEIEGILAHIPGGQP